MMTYQLTLEKYIAGMEWTPAEARERDFMERLERELEKARTGLANAQAEGNKQLIATFENAIAIAESKIEWLSNYLNSDTPATEEPAADNSMVIYDFEREIIRKIVAKNDYEQLARFWREQAQRTESPVQKRMFEARSQWYWEQESKQYVASYGKR